MKELLQIDVKNKNNLVMYVVGLLILGVIAWAVFGGGIGRDGNPDQAGIDRINANLSTISQEQQRQIDLSRQLADEVKSARAELEGIRGEIANSRAELEAIRGEMSVARSQLNQDAGLIKRGAEIIDSARKRGEGQGSQVGDTTGPGDSPPGSQGNTR